MSEKDKSAIFILSEINRLKIIQDVIERHLSPAQAAEHLGVTPRHLSRLLKRYRDFGPLGMCNRSRGKVSNRKLPTHFIRNVLNIIRENYIDFGLTLVREKLEQLHKITLGKETVRRIMIQDNLWAPRKKKVAKAQQPRPLRACIGELIQIDGSHHRWFEDRGPACTALVYVDDASSRIMQLQFVESESTFSYFEATRDYLEMYGKPLTFYCDKASVFRVNRRSVNNNTQFQRAMDELNIKLISAETSSAKGRVERAHKTLQDRLVKEFRLRGINTMAAANAFAKEYMEDYNSRFANVPRLSHDVHRPLEDSDDLDSIFTIKTTHRVSKSLTFQYKKVSFLIVDTEVSRRAIGKDIELWQYLDGYLELRMNNVFLSCRGYLNGGQICINSLTSRDDSLKFISRIFKRIEKAKARFNNLHGRSYNVIL
ncbi:ISNCY family transposase [Salmonella enterica]|nr:ISNCY family transposase [Salmonella enterica]